MARVKKNGRGNEEIEKKSISNERFRAFFKIHWIERTKIVHDRINKYDKKNYDRKKKKLRENVNINWNVLVLAEKN